jgi:hypothetical protein
MHIQCYLVGGTAAITAWGFAAKLLFQALLKLLLGGLFHPEVLKQVDESSQWPANKVFPIKAKQMPGVCAWDCHHHTTLIHDQPNPTSIHKIRVGDFGDLQQQSANNHVDLKQRLCLGAVPASLLMTALSRSMPSMSHKCC